MSKPAFLPSKAKSNAPQIQENYSDIGKAQAYINRAVWNLNSAPSAMSEIELAVNSLTEEIKNSKAKDKETQINCFRACKGALLKIEEIAAEMRNIKALSEKRILIEPFFHKAKDYYHRHLRLSMIHKYFLLVQDFLEVSSSGNKDFNEWIYVQKCLKRCESLPISNSRLQLGIKKYLKEIKPILINIHSAEAKESLDSSGWPGKPSGADTEETFNASIAFSKLSKICDKTAISLIIDPVRTRFQFHFCGDKPTSSPIHPEWYITYLRGPLVTNEPYLRQIIQSTEHFERVVKEIEALAHMKFENDLNFLERSPALLLRTLVQLAAFSFDVHTLYCVPELGLLLDEPLQDRVISILAQYIKDLIIQDFLELQEAWDKFYDLEVDLSSADGEDGFKISVFQQKIGKLEILFNDLGSKLEREFSKKFFQYVAGKAFVECSSIIAQKVFQNRGNIEIQARMCSTLLAIASAAHEWRLVIPGIIDNELFLEDILEKLDKSIHDGMDILVKDILDEAEGLIKLEKPFAAGMSWQLYQVRQASDQRTFTRIFLRIVQRADYILLRQLGQLRTAEFVIQTHGNLCQLLEQFSPPSITKSLKLPQSDYILELSRMSILERQEMLDTLLMVSSGNEMKDSTFQSVLSVPQTIKVLRNFRTVH